VRGEPSTKYSTFTTPTSDDIELRVKLPADSDTSQFISPYRAIAASNVLEAFSICWSASYDLSTAEYSSRAVEAEVLDLARTMKFKTINLGCVDGLVMLRVNESERSLLRSRAPAQADHVVAEETDDYVQQLNKGSSNILVAVRARPFTKKEREVNTFEIFEILDDKVVILLDPSLVAPVPEEAFRVNRSKEKRYAFDYVFDKTSSQQDVYDRTTGFLLEGVIAGFNATVFAYGATGAGKTYTMLGDQDCPGVMLKTIMELFRSMDANSFERRFKVKLSYLEIYNENIRDLISNSNDHLEVWEDPVRGVNVAGLTEVHAENAETVVDMVRIGNRRRTCEPTMANETSSRSHAVLQISIEHTDKASGSEAEVVLGKLSLIDLAGSERASNTQNRGLRLIEGANINRSLLALGNCINALYDANMKGTKSYIPYRDSKLTRILKDSLGGNCRTVMIACISPCVKTFEDTHNTLKYANRAKNIKTSAARNVLNVSHHVTKYTSIIATLKKEIVDLRSQLSTRQQNPVLPKIVATERYIKGIESHFEEEALTLSRIREIEQNVEKMGFTLFSRLTETNQVDVDPSRRQMLEVEVQVLKSTIAARNRALDAEQTKLATLHKQRDGFKQAWSKAMLAPDQLKELQLALKEGILKVESSLMQLKEVHSGVVVKQRESYISFLQSQVKIRDSIIDTHTTVFAKKNIPPISHGMYTGLLELDRLDTIGTVGKVCYPSYLGQSEGSYSKSTGVIGLIDEGVTLPKINSMQAQSVRYRSTKAMSNRATPKDSQVTLFKQPVTLEHKKPSLYRRKISTDSEAPSTMSLGVPTEALGVLKVADRFNKSPYVRADKSSVEKPKRHRIDQKDIRYGSVIRRVGPRD
jgi:kinesin family protein 18/19